VIFAELQYDVPYAEVHAPLVALLRAHFPHVRAGLQGDSWIWVQDDAAVAEAEAEAEEQAIGGGSGGRGALVAVDTFTAARHEVKSAAPSALVTRVIAVLAQAFDIRVLPSPVLEAHDDEACGGSAEAADAAAAGLRSRGADA
jgi:hypothetical protein